MRRILRLLSVLSLVVVLAAGGLAGFLLATGRLTAERIDQIAAILRGESLVAATTTAPAPTEEVKPQTATKQIAHDQAQQEMLALLADRRLRELEDRSRLNERIHFEVTQKLEEIQRREAEFAEQRKKLAQQSTRDGFEAEQGIVASIDPTRARELLMMMEKDADVVRLVLAMEADRRKKIFNTCKTPQEMGWARRILDQLRSHGIDRADAEAPGSSELR